MKQNMLQIIIPMYGSQKKLEKYIQLIQKYIRKTLGIQKQGKPRSNLFKVVCGILYYLKTGCQWRFLPPIFGKWRTVYGWYVLLSSKQVFEKCWLVIVKYSANRGILKLQDLLCDGSLILTTSNISLKSKNPRMKNKNCVNRLALTDKKGQPLALHIAKGTANDTNFMIPLVDQLSQHMNYLRDLLRMVIKDLIH